MEEHDANLCFICGKATEKPCCKVEIDFPEQGLRFILEIDTEIATLCQDCARQGVEGGQIGLLTRWQVLSYGPAWVAKDIMRKMSGGE